MTVMFRDLMSATGSTNNKTILWCFRYLCSVFNTLGISSTWLTTQYCFLFLAGRLIFSGRFRLFLIGKTTLDQQAKVNFRNHSTFCSCFISKYRNIMMVIGNSLSVLSFRRWGDRRVLCWRWWGRINNKTPKILSLPHSVSQKEMFALRILILKG